MTQQICGYRVLWVKEQDMNFPRGLAQRPVEGLTREPSPCNLGRVSCYVTPVGFPGACTQVGRCSWFRQWVSGFIFWLELCRFNVWMGIQMTAESAHGG